jgi:hypothetical protein
MSDNPFAMLAEISIRRAMREAPPVPQEIPAGMTHTEAIRDLLRKSGPKNALAIAVILDLPDSGRVAALLKGDLRKGSVQLVGGRYQINDDYDAQLARELSQAAALLRRHGWGVKEPK